MEFNNSSSDVNDANSSGHDLSAYNASPTDVLETSDMHVFTGGCERFLFILIVVIGLICCFGLAGNIVSFVVLQRKMKHSSATLLLRALAVADSSFLVMTAAYGPFIADFDGLFARVLWPLLEMSRLGTIWVTVLVAVNHYLAMCRQLQASRLCTERRVKQQLAVTAVCVVLYNIPLTVQFVSRNEALDSYAYDLVYRSILYSIVYVGLPLSVISVLNVCLVRHLYASRSTVRRHTSQAHANDERSVTIIMVFVILVFLFCQAAGVYNRAVLITGYPSCGDVNFYLVYVNIAIVLSNSGVNFIIYCAVGRQFRAGLKQLCRCKCSCRRDSSPAGLSLEVIQPKNAKLNAV